MKSLTKRQLEILNYIRDFVIENDYAPSYREIANHFDLSSISTIAEHVNTLKLKGYLESEPAKARSMQLADTDSQEPALIRLMGLIAAGKPIETIRSSETIEIPKDMMGEQVYALKVKGDSMIDDGILSGDYVIIEECSQPNNGDIIVAIVDESYATLKRYYKRYGTVRLQPANKKYQPIYPKQLTIQGRVKGVIRKFMP